MWPWHVKMATQNLLRLLLLLILMMRIVLATVCCILRGWGLVIKQNFCSDFKHKVSSRYWSWSSGKVFKLEFGQYFAADVLQRLWSWILVEILKLGLVKILKLKFYGEVDVWLRNFKSMLGQDSEDEIWSRFVFELVIWTQPSGPLCLWQRFHFTPGPRAWGGGRILPKPWILQESDKGQIYYWSIQTCSRIMLLFDGLSPC